MAYTRKQLITCVSIVYLVFVTALSGFASSRTNRLSSPISDVLSGFTTALPIVAGLLLEGGYDLTRQQERRRRAPRGETARPPLVIIANTIIFIYSSVVITLLGTHAAPASGLDCGLEETWKKMFSKKNEDGIRAIQDAFKCCGFANSHDRAWPFPSKGHDIHSCETAFGRTNGCFGPWKREEQNMAGVLMGVVGLVFIWQVAIIATPTKRESWLHRVLPDRVSRLISDEEQGSSNGPRHAIDYPNYSDNVVEEVSEEETESTPQRTIEGGVRKARNALTGAEDEEEEHQPTIENAWARD
ncbi:hypothetical protein K505DRAFT_407462 [Melanomma pulvis-pyrius CBS 109.77]|uniref:Tetraspanin Tsp3 n=1 Tax=Melanomma pulvis-pyrius CBS 109.77 TaxID=1314802 RepID=A0A6A6XEI9_9PLEO|nr:hypothetical protein K505DRAFT_407462 [Melanomma pulvis-pyrius CBS 109.77]